MTRYPARVAMVTLALIAPPASAQSVVDLRTHLVVDASRPLRIALDRRVHVKQPGQPVTGTLIEAVYAYDRIVLPAGTRAIGHVAAIERTSLGTHLRTLLAGDFTPPRRLVLEFDTLVLTDGRTIPMHTSATEGAEHVVLRMADAPARTGPASKAREEIASRAKEAAAAITAPNKVERLKVAAIRALPYHPRLLPKGTVYTARLTSPIDFGFATAAPRAAAGAKPTTGSIMKARLLTAIGSATSTRGSPIEAVLTQPVLAADGSLILPEGSTLTGEVTLTRPARRFHRQGQLRFLFERVQALDGPAAPLLAALHAVESSQGNTVRIDEEGGARGSSSSVRFAAPALAALALVGATHGRLDYDTDGLGPEMQYGSAASGALGGVVSLGLFGLGVNQFGRYVTVATATLGLAHTVYSAVFAKGRDVSFPTDTSIQVELAPGPGAIDNTQEPRR